MNARKKKRYRGRELAAIAAGRRGRGASIAVPVVIEILVRTRYGIEPIDVIGCKRVCRRGRGRRGLTRE